MKQIKKVLIVFILLMVGFVMVSCGSTEEETSSYPSKTPMVSNSTDTYVDYLGQIATNADAYVNLKFNYGTDVVLRWLASLVCTEGTGFDTYYEEISSEEDFEETCESLGLETEEEIKDYYHQIYAQYSYAETVETNKQTNIDALAAILEAIQIKKYITEDFTLNVGDDTNEITWTSSAEYISISDEEATVTRGHYDAEVTLTATISNDDYSTTATYEVIVPATTTETFDSESYAEVEAVHYITDDEIEDYYEENYHEDVTAVVITFNSSAEAIDALNKTSTNLIGTNKETFDNPDNAFLAIFNYKYKNGINLIQDIAFSHSYDDWADSNSTICSTIYSLEDGEYTPTPLFSGTKCYMVYRLSSNPCEELDDVKDTIKAEIFKQNVEADHTDDVIKAIVEGGTIEIFDEMLEVSIESYISAAYTDEDECSYESTENESDTVVVRYTKTSGEVCELTADQLFEKLNALKGNVVTYNYIQKFMILACSEIVDATTHEVKENMEDDYDEIYEDEVTEVKEAFENGDYEDSGYPASYGFENYLRDYYGYNSEWDLLTTTESSIYSKALTVFKKQATDGKHEEIYAEAKETIDEYFNVTSCSLQVYYDRDSDLQPDSYFGDHTEINDDLYDYLYDFATFWENNKDSYDESEYSDLKFYSKVSLTDYNECVKLLCVIKDIVLGNTYVKGISEEIAELESYEDKLEYVVKEYDNASFYHSTFGQYKREDMCISYTSSVSYTNSSSLTDLYLEQLETIYNDVQTLSDYAGFSLYGENLEHGYAEDNGVSFTFAPVLSNTFANANKCTMLFAVSAKAKTLYKDDYQKTLDCLTEENYNEYYKTVDDDDDTTGVILSAVKTIITTYYVPAMTTLQTEYYESIPSMISEAYTTSQIYMNETAQKDFVAYVASLIEE